MKIALRMSMLALIPIALAACVGDETRAMTQACERVVAQGDASGSAALLRDADAKLASLKQPTNAFTRRIRDLQDPSASQFKDDLQDCVWRLRSLRG